MYNIGEPTFGLKLQKTKSLAESIERRVNATNENKNRITVQQRKEKLTAEHFPIAFLQIGQYMLTSLHEAHLVAKCYYAKKACLGNIR